MLFSKADIFECIRFYFYRNFYFILQRSNTNTCDIYVTPVFSILQYEHLHKIGNSIIPKHYSSNRMSISCVCTPVCNKFSKHLVLVLCYYLFLDFKFSHTEKKFFYLVFIQSHAVYLHVCMYVIPTQKCACTFACRQPMHAMHTGNPYMR